jgi:hypothetical protein
MKEYIKIDSVFKRDERGNFLIGDFSRPEFEYLKDNPWLWTEKIDGTNIRVMWDGENVRYGGKTDNAQIPTKLITWLQDNFTAPKFFDACLESSLCLYGEGYGAGIQSGGNYSAEQKFILFDVKIGDWWLERKNVEDIGAKLGLDVVALYPENLSLIDMIRKMHHEEPMISWLALQNGGQYMHTAEGVVGTPLVPLFARNGDRIITKIKYKDFK